MNPTIRVVYNTLFYSLSDFIFILTRTSELKFNLSLYRHNSSYLAQEMKLEPLRYGDGDLKQ